MLKESTDWTDAMAANAGVHSEYRPIETPTHPQAVKALEFWNARPTDGIIIGRDVPSRAIANLLSYVIIHEPINGGSDLKVRLAGASIRKRFGRDVTGETMSHMFQTPDFPDRRKSVLTAIETGAPQFAFCLVTNGSLVILHTELVIMPVLAHDHVTKWGLTVASFFN